MSYTTDHKAAARRLRDAATTLYDHEKPAVSGYLFGLATECALKFVAATFPNGRGEDIQREHFPGLRTALRLIAEGRRATGLRRLVGSDVFMNQWSIDMRYARNEDFHTKPIDVWKQNATAALNLMEGWH